MKTITSIAIVVKRLGRTRRSPRCSEQRYRTHIIDYAAAQDLGDFYLLTASVRSR